MPEPLIGKYGLPTEVVYCRKCVESNQRMISSIQHGDTTSSNKDTITFDQEDVCSACRYYERKKALNWNERERELRDLLDRFRRHDGRYDVVVPGSGGKDSCFASHLLKHKYGMHPLTVTWAPHMYTDIGWKNFQSWIHSGADNILFTPNGLVHRALTRLAFENLLHPFQPFVFGQYYLPSKVAVKEGIKLIFYADSGAERGIGSNVKVEGQVMDSRLYSRDKEQDLFFGGVHVNELPKYGINREDLNPYLPLNGEIVAEAGIEVYFLPYYINYDPQKIFYYAVEHTGFEPNPDGRSEGTYTKYSSLDDKVDGFHYFTWFIKTGRGRATEDAAIEIRNGHITREEGVALVRRFDGEFPMKYFRDFLWYVSMTEDRFWEIINQGRSPHIWDFRGSQWVLRTQVS